MNLSDAVKSIQLKELEALLAVADMLSFSQAAKSLGVSQPSISIKIKNLEKKFGKTLFVRQGRRVILTPDGRDLTKAAEELFESLRKVAVILSQNPSQSLIRISVGEAIFLQAFPELIHDYSRSTPEVKCDITIGDSITNLEDVESGKSDIAMVGWISREHLKSEELVVEQICEDELVVIVPVGHPLASRNKVSLRDIMGYGYIARKTSSGVQRTVIDILKKSGYGRHELNVVAVLDNASSVIMAVYRNIGISIVSKLQAETARSIGLIRVIRLEEHISKRPAFAIRRRRASETVRTFFDYSVDYVKERIHKIPLQEPGRYS